MKVIGVIPARMASRRFPGKPLCLIHGITMIEHVYQRSIRSQLLNEIYVATCDDVIADEVKRFGGKVIMTPDTFVRCTDRVSFAVDKIGSDADIVVIIQGDEPLVHPEMINAAVRPLLDDHAREISCTCLIKKISSDTEFNDLNEVKVVKDTNDFALYFSRAPIPAKRMSENKIVGYKQVCIMPYRKDFIRKFTQLSPTPLEQAESVDMLRIIENGYRVKLVESYFATCSVDVEEDRKRVETLMMSDALLVQYGSKVP